MFTLLPVSCYSFNMEISEAQYERIREALPVQRGNVSLSNLQLLNALLYVLEHGCKWRGLPKHFGNWHTIYTRMNRWSKNGVLDRVFEKLQLEQILRVRVELFALDSTSVKVHPDAAGALKKRTAVHRYKPRRPDHQASFGCRGCSHGRKFPPVAGQRARRAGGPRAFARARADT